MFNRCFQLFGFPKEGCDWKIRKAKVQCCTEPTPVWNILKHWNHHESSGIVVIHQVASYELALQDRLKLRPEVAVFFPPGRSWLLQVYGIQVWNPMESKMHWKDLKGWFDVQWGIGRLCPSMWQNNTAQGWSNWVMFSRTYCGGGGAGREFKCTNQIKPAWFNKFYVFYCFFRLHVEERAWASGTCPSHFLVVFRSVLAGVASQDTCSSRTPPAREWTRRVHFSCPKGGLQTKTKWSQMISSNCFQNKHQSDWCRLSGPAPTSRTFCECPGRLFSETLI